MFLFTILVLMTLYLFSVVISHTDDPALQSKYKLKQLSEQSILSNDLDSG